MKQEILLSQKQVLSQHMRLSLKILQMNRLDLHQYIQSAALENPLIELSAQSSLENLEYYEQLYEEQDNGETWENYTLCKKPAYGGSMDDDLRSWLSLQLAEYNLDKETLKALRFLIDNLDERGYLQECKEAAKNLGISDNCYISALDILHRLDPPGIGAKNLEECLSIQAKRMGASYILMEIINGHLDLIAKNKISKIAKILNVPISQVQKARDELLTLNPIPGNGYCGNGETPYIEPDIYIVNVDGELKAILLEAAGPMIQINEYYQKLKINENPHISQYIKNCINEAKNLVYCVNKRQATLLKCTEAILSLQRNFFEKGPGHLSPMSLDDVAEKTEIHSSTVSRASSEKYLQCRWGIFPLKYFFEKRVNQGDGISRDVTLYHIKNIIDNEDNRSPLSDREISEKLRELGISVSRRAVTKYRESLNFATALGRKKP